MGGPSLDLINQAHIECTVRTYLAVVSITAIPLSGSGGATQRMSNLVGMGYIRNIVSETLVEIAAYTVALYARRIDDLKMGWTATKDPSLEMYIIAAG